MTDDDIYVLSLVAKDGTTIAFRCDPIKAQHVRSVMKKYNRFWIWDEKGKDITNDE